MNNLFTLRTPKKMLYNKAYITVQSQSIITETISTSLPALQNTDPIANYYYSLFINPQKSSFTITVYSQDSNVLTLLKLHQLSLEQTIQQELIDKKIIDSYIAFKLKIVYR